ncbi:flagellar protein FlaG [Robertmurraya andreesenii]|uniref:Flagellar protein FlaG n=1 Tax=Anoxybacillus andreesenii TaxID=1325932 RepID=A0ABT9V825_9BACL|nr:flagellar protein FlaG [Robertmurraya andreesenii]MDQ0157101.1 flagellar protein FlaG [Robertmurraya andreesenii]
MKINGLASSTGSVESTQSKQMLKVEARALIEKHQEEQQNARTKTDEEKKKELTKDDIEHIVNGMNEFLKPHYTSLNFKMHEDLDRYYVEVIDQDTKKVIREIPERELLDMYAKMTHFLGLFIDKKL